MAWISIAVATLFFLLGGLCVLAVLLQLPGTWILLALAVLVELVDGLYLPAGARTTFGVPALLFCLALAGLGEVLEFLAGAVGLRKGGGSARGFWGSLIGGFAGLFVFGPVLAFLPVLGAFLGVLVGTFLGALVGELSHERHTVHTAWRPALWASIGRLAGTTGKLALALVVWLFLSVRAFLV